MVSDRQLISRGSSALVLAAAVAVLGCPRAGDRIQPRTSPASSPPAQTAPAPPPPPPPPNDLDLAIQTARSAAAQGDLTGAVEQYRKAAGLTLDSRRLADILYTLAMLEADPNNPARNLEEARADLQRFLTTVADHPLEREGRVTAVLMDEAAQMRTESATLKAELELQKTEVAVLKAKLEEAEKELAGIKKVLLQNKAKP